MLSAWQQAPGGLRLWEESSITYAYILFPQPGSYSFYYESYFKKWSPVVISVQEYGAAHCFEDGGYFQLQEAAFLSPRPPVCSKLLWGSVPVSQPSWPQEPGKDRAGCAVSVGVSPTLAGAEWSTLAWGSKPVPWGHVGLTWDAVLFMQPSTGKKKKKKSVLGAWFEIKTWLWNSLSISCFYF